MTQQPTAGYIPQWTLGDRLRKARIDAGLTQAQLEEHAGISRRSAVNYEQGKTAPGRKELIAWSVATGVPLVWLETGEAPSETPNPRGGQFVKATRRLRVEKAENRCSLPLDVPRLAVPDLPRVA